MQQRGFSPELTSQPSQQPLVSICTVTYDRPEALKLLEKRILEQTYPRERMEWVVIDDSPSNIPNFEPDTNSGLKVVYQRLPEKLPLGKKRNTSNDFCRGDIVVYMDDDDYYPPTRVEHAVQKLISSDCLVAGSTILPILFVPENELWVSGPFSKNHATANTFAFKRELLNITRFEDDATCAEEKKFLQDYSIQMVQLEPKHTIVCIGHNRNTYEKRQLIQGGKNPRFKRITDLNQSQTNLLQEIFLASMQATRKSTPQRSPSSSAISSSKSTSADFKIILRALSPCTKTKECIHSLKRQSNAFFEVTVITQDLNEEQRTLLAGAIEGDPRFHVHSKSNQASTYLSDILQALHAIKPTPEDILIVLEDEFSLPETDCLQIIAHTYRAKQCLLTYGGLAKSPESPIETQPLDPRIITNIGSRQANWIPPQLRTFKAGLLEFVNPLDLHDNDGSILNDTGETVFWHALFEIASHRSEYTATKLLIGPSKTAKPSQAITENCRSEWNRYPYGPAPFIRLNTLSDSLTDLEVEHQRAPLTYLSIPQNAPTASVIVPTHGRPKHLLKAIRLFQSQTWPNKELLILDDSPEKCEAAAQEAERDPRICYRHQKERLRIGEKRNILCSMARGEIIAHFDDDDYYSPSYMENMINKMSRMGVDFIKLRSWWTIHVPTKTYGFCNTSQLDRTRFYKLSAQGVSAHPSIFSEEQVNKILHGYGFSYVYKKSLFRKAQFPKFSDHGEDIAFANQCIQAGIKIGLCDDLEGNTVHAIHSSNTSTCFAQHIISKLSVLSFTSARQIPQGAIVGL